MHLRGTQRTMKITFASFVLLIQTFLCLAFDDSEFQLSNSGSGFCLVKTTSHCSAIRWTTADRLLVPQIKKCLGVQGKSVGSEVGLYICNENSEFQKWECKNGTLLALKGQELYIELTADNTAVLSRAIGPNNHLIILGTSEGACTRIYRELYTVGGNAAGLPCMFPFQYKNQWYSDCTAFESSQNNLWCAVETRYQNELWGYCPTASKERWNKHTITGAYYQLNTQSALTWAQADTSCRQQGASLLSITDPHQQAYVTALIGTLGNRVWTGLISEPDHGWKWTNGKPYRYMRWDSGYPLPDPGHNCVIIEPAVQYFWQSSPCSKKHGYICYSDTAEELPTRVAETGFCSSPWILYNGHCFHLNRTERTWSDAQRECRNSGGDLVSIRYVEDQSFVVSQLGYASTDELWIGLNDRKTEGLFDWIDHSAVTFTSWEFGRPDVSSEIKDCVLITGKNGNWADRVCEEKHGSICTKMSASKSSGEEVLQDAGCRIGWKRHGSYCYFISTQTKTFNEARDDCSSYNSYLADVLNGVDNAFLVSLVGLRPEKYFWLGLSNQNNMKRFVWTNTILVKFTHWNALMPGNLQGCVAMKTGIFAGLWDVLPCTIKAKYVCKCRAEGASVTTVAPTLNQNRCEPGWYPLGSRDYCAKAYQNRKKTWYEAKDYCRGIGGDLLSIHTATDLRSYRYRYGYYWIGLSAPDPATGYVWSDGSPVQFLNWADGQPNNKNNVESCAEVQNWMQNRNSSWNDVHCEKYNDFLCQIRSGVTPKPPPSPSPPDYNTTYDGWLQWRGNQYYIIRHLKAMEEARHLCQQKNSDLVKIDSEAEGVFLWKRISRNLGAYWIDLTVDLDGTFGWMDGSPVEFQRWNHNQPRFLSNDEHCVVMTSSMGFWHNYNCGLQNNAICKRSDSSKRIPPTVAPTVPPRGGCPQNWKKMDSKCFKVVQNNNKTWEGARTQCKALGGNLASILTRKVQVFLTTAMAEAPNTDLWIGATSVYWHQFHWTDGRPMNYRNWGTRIIYARHPMRRSVLHHYYDNYYEVDDKDSSLPYARQCAVMKADLKFGLGKWMAKSCNDTHGYVCLRKVDPSLPDTPAPTSSHYVTIFNDSFKSVSRPMTWNAAKRNCQADGAQLASVRSEWSQSYIELRALNLNASLWIGLNSIETGGYFRFIAGWHLSTTNWDINEPQANNPCVFVSEDGKWRTADCNQKMASICMKSTDVPPTESSEFKGFCPVHLDRGRSFQQKYTWIPFKSYCYLFTNERATWPSASANCAILGGTLTSIEDPSEQEFIHRNIKLFQDDYNSYWIGLFKTHNGLLRWLDKAVVDYTNWDSNQLYSQSYGSIQTENGKWTTAEMQYHRPYICKTPKVLLQEQTTTVNTMTENQTGRNILLPVGLVITAIAIGAVIAIFVIKKSGYRFSFWNKSSHFDNPLIFNTGQSTNDLSETSGTVDLSNVQ